MLAPALDPWPYPTHLVTHDQNYRYTIKGSSTTGNIFFLFEYLSILPGPCLYVCWGLENKMYLTPYQAMTHLYFLSHDHGCSKNLLWKHLRLVSTIDGGDECNVEHKSIFWQMVITWLRGASYVWGSFSRDGFCRAQSNHEFLPRHVRGVASYL